MIQTTQSHISKSVPVRKISGKHRQTALSSLKADTVKFSAINETERERQAFLEKIERLHEKVRNGEFTILEEPVIISDLGDHFQYEAKIIVNGEEWTIERKGLEDLEASFTLETEFNEREAFRDNSIFFQNERPKGISHKFLELFQKRKSPYLEKYIASDQEFLRLLQHCNRIVYSSNFEGLIHYERPLQDLTLRKKALNFFKELETNVLGIKKEDYLINFSLEDQLAFSDSANMDTLNKAIEKIELSLRRIIVEALADDPNQLPPHILQKINERAAKSKATTDATSQQGLQGKLEYADLRELQDIITSKALWPKFQDRFGTKDFLGVKFNQLAELRNGIRHSRTIDVVAQKEGEAATIWFTRILEKKPATSPQSP